jgi:hypothetical protein
LPAEGAQVLGGPARVELERSLKVADGPLALSKQLEDPDPHGMPEGAEELGLQLINGGGSARAVRASLRGRAHPASPDRPPSAIVGSQKRGTSERKPKVIAAIVACKILKDKKFFDYVSLNSLRSSIESPW